jgi:hypothetical protein
MGHPLHELPGLLREAVGQMMAEMKPGDYAAGMEIFESMCRANPMPADSAGITPLTFAALTFLLGAMPPYLGVRATSVQSPKQPY